MMESVLGSLLGKAVGEIVLWGLRQVTEPRRPLPIPFDPADSFWREWRRRYDVPVSSNNPSSASRDAGTPVSSSQSDHAEAPIRPDAESVLIESARLAAGRLADLPETEEDRTCDSAEDSFLSQGTGLAEHQVDRTRLANHLTSLSRFNCQSVGVIVTSAIAVVGAAVVVEYLADRAAEWIKAHPDELPDKKIKQTARASFWIGVATGVFVGTATALVLTERRRA